MTKDPSADEQPKREIARKVVAEKRRYFEPHRDYVAEEVQRKAKGLKASSKPVTEEKEGDG